MKSVKSEIEQYRIVAIASCALSCGLIIGILISKIGVGADNSTPSFDLVSAFVDIANTVEPSVVHISTVTKDEKAIRGNGSGFIVDSNGYILTNYHVIIGADRIKVKFNDGGELPATVIGGDRETDLAVLKVTPNTALKPAKIGDSEKIKVGDWVAAIGSPFGLEQTMTAGIISARQRDAADLYKKAGFQYFLQTDAAINRGNSGGPLINLAGEVIGINTSIATSTGDYNGVCFALPSSVAISIYKQLVQNGRVIRGFLGAMPERVTPQIAKVYGLPSAYGAIISNVNPSVTVDGKTVESPAAKAGIQQNDIILDFNGYKITNEAELLRRTASTPVGTNVPLSVWRNGKTITLSVTIGQRPSIETITPSSLSSRGGNNLNQKSQNIGISIQSLFSEAPGQSIESLIEKDSGKTRTRTTTANKGRGVLVTDVESGSVADDAEIKPNDIIEMINLEPVRNKDDFKTILNRLKSGDSIVFQVYRENLKQNPRIFISLTKP